MLPPVSTRHLLTAIDKKRRDDAALRWSQSFQPGRAPQPARRPTGMGSRDAGTERTNRA